MATIVEIDRDDLVAVLNPVSKFVGKTLKATAFVRLFVEEGVLAAEAMNGRSAARMVLPTTKVEKDLDVQVHPKFLDAIKSMKSGDLKLTITTNNIEISGAGKSKFDLPLSSDKLPETGLDTLPPGEEVDLDEIMPILERAAKFASEDDKRQSIFGVHVMLRDGHVVVVSTDSYRFYHETTELTEFPGLTDGTGITLPLGFIRDIAGIAKGTVQLSTDGKVILEDGGFRYSTSITAEKFPDVEAIIKISEPEFILKFGRDEADREMERAAVLAEKGATVNVFIRDSEVFARIQGGMGSSEVAWEADTEKCRSELRFNLSYFRNGIGVVNGDEIQLGVSDDKRKPAILMSEDGSRKYVISTLAESSVQPEAAAATKKKKGKKGEEPEDEPVPAGEIGDDEDEDGIDL